MRSNVKVRELLAYMGIVAALTFVAQQSIAQSPIGVLSDANHPSGAPDPLKPDAIWHVDPLTGALNVNVPFATTPVGGRGPIIPYALHYNSSATVAPYFDSAQNTYGSGTVPNCIFAATGDGCVDLPIFNS